MEKGAIPIKIQPTVDAKDVKAAARELEGEFNKVFESTAGKKISKPFQDLQKEMKKTSAEAKEVADKMTELEQVKTPTKEYQKTQNEIKKISYELEKAKKDLETFNSLTPEQQAYKEDMFGVGYAVKEVQKLEQALTTAKAKLRELNATGKDFKLGTDSKEYKDLTAQLQGLNDKGRVQLSSARSELKKLGDEADTTDDKVSRMRNTLSQMASSFISNVKSMTNSFKRLSKQIIHTGWSITKAGFSKLIGIFTGAGNSSQGFTYSLKQGLRSILAYGLGITTLVSLFNKLQAAAVEGFQNMAQQIPEVNRDISALLSSFQTFKNSVATMFQPLLAAITPVLTKIIDMLTEVTNKVGQFFAAITGQSYVYKATKAQVNYAESLDKTTKSQKKQKKALKEQEKELGAYDKLLVIQKKKQDELNDDQPDAGAGNKFDPSKGGFKKVPIDPKMLKFLDWLKDMWQKGDFFELGNKFAEWLATTLDKIPWDKIKGIAAKLGKSLATLFNGIFASLHLANSLGRTIAEMFNTALEFAYNFATNFDFKQFGKWLGTFISSALRTVDWTKLKDLGTTLGKGLADALNGFLTTDALVQVGGAIGNFFRAIVNFAWSLVTTINWEKLGDRLRQGLNAFLNRMLDVDESGKSGFTKLGETISGLIKGVFTAINQVLGDADTRAKIGKALKEFFDGFDYSGVKESMLTLAGNIVKLFFSALGGAFQSANFREAFGDVTKIVKVVFGVIFVTSAVKAVAGTVAKAFLGEIGKQLAIGLVTSGAGGAAMSSVVASFTSFGASIIGGIKAGATAALAGLKAFFTSTLGAVFAGIVAFFTVAEIGKKIGGAIFPDDKELYNEYSGIKGTFVMLKDFVVAMGEQIAEAGKLLWERLGERFNQIGQSLKNMLTNWGNAIRNFWNMLTQLKDGIANATTRRSTISSFGQGFKSGLNNIKVAVQRKALGLADGAVIPPNHEFLARLGDQKSGVNIETPLDTMVQAFKLAMADGNGSSNQQPIVLQLNGRTVAQVVWDEQKKRYSQTGQYRPRMG